MIEASPPPWAETMHQDPLPLDWHPARIAERRRAFLSPALGTFTAYESPLVWRRGSGAYLWDADGKRHLDAMAQNVCISVGYRHPGVDAAVRAQLDEIQHVTTVYAHPQPGQFAEELVARLPVGHDWVVHFVNSGAEAIDLAVLVARLHTRHFEVLTLRDAYHGMHFTAMAATGIGAAHQPLPPAPGFVNVIAPHSYRGLFGADAPPYLQELSRMIGSATSGALAALMALGLGAWWVRARRRRAPRAAMVNPAAPGATETLARAIASLDAEFERKGAANADARAAYEGRRRELKRELSAELATALDSTSPLS